MAGDTTAFNIDTDAILNKHRDELLLTLQMILFFLAETRLLVPEEGWAWLERGHVLIDVVGAYVALLDDAAVPIFEQIVYGEVGAK